MPPVVAPPAAAGSAPAAPGPSPAAGTSTAAGPSTVCGAGLGALVAGVLALIAAAPLRDNSFLTHLATGRVLLADGWPTTNPFLVGGGDFPVPSWWWSGVLALVDEVAGGAGIRLLVAAAAGALGWLLVRLADPPGADRRDRGLLALCVPALLGALAVLPYVAPRPHLVGYLLLAVTLVVWWERRSPWWLVPVFATWVNVHGTWLHGLVVLALLAAAGLVDDWTAQRARPPATAWRRAAAAPLAAAVGVVIGGALYPERFRLVLLPTEQFGSAEAREVLGSYVEWQRPAPTDLLFWVLVVVAVVAVGGSLRRRAWGTAAAALALSLLGATALRLVPVAVITLLPVVALALTGVGSIARPGRRAAAVLTAVGVVLGAAALAWCVTGPAYSGRGYPVALVDRLEGAGLVGPAAGGAVVVTPDYVGNYLSWRYGTAAPVWVDDRPGVDRGSEYLDLRRLRPGWRDTLAASGASAVVWESDDDLAAELDADPGWVAVATAEDFRLWCRPEVASSCSAGRPGGP